MPKKLLVAILIVLSIIAAGMTWYFISIPKVETLRNNTLKTVDYTPTIGLSSSLEKDKTRFEWLNGVCSPFQKNIQSIFASTQKDFETPFVTVFLLNKESQKVERSLAFASSKSWSDTISYIKSNCLAEIFDNRDKYKEIYRNNDSGQLTLIDYKVEYEKYLKQQELNKRIKEVCGDPDLWVYYNTNNNKFPRKVTKEEVLVCVNTQRGEDINKSFEDTFQFTLQRENILKAITASQELLN